MTAHRKGMPTGMAQAPAPTTADRRDAFERGMADAHAGRTVPGEQALEEFRELADRLKDGAGRRGAAGG